MATHFLTARDPVRADEAAQVALSAGSASDDPPCDLVLASDAQDRHADGDEYVRRIMANHAEIDENLPPRTCNMLLRRRYLNAGVDFLAGAVFIAVMWARAGSDGPGLPRRRGLRAPWRRLS